MVTRIKKEEEYIFSLDIGTRTIIGIICKENDQSQIEIIDLAIREHEKRNMYDGQIHNIEGVANLAKEIVLELEDRLNIKIKSVSVAAAGRALKTEKAFIEKTIDDREPINSFQIEALEIEAVQKAQENINKKEGNSGYYSVGYSVSNYYLDEDKIENLKGHKASRIGIEVLSTFLPKIVVESLYAVISLVGLQIDTITLEPIAAINLAIEKDLRLLNLALVDIGAGTSDIAITDEGHIVSYAMTQMAGDEITESIVKKYLLDFNTSERLKKELNISEEHNVVNILGEELKLTSQDILKDIDKTIGQVAKSIATSIIESNKKSPDAIFLVGGSSQMPGVSEKIADFLDMDRSRVRIKRLSTIKAIQGGDKLDRPDMITPLGIAMEGLENKYRNFIKISFMDKEFKVFNTGGIKVSDILVISNFNPRDLMPKWGKDFIYYKDGKKRTIKGRQVTRPEILVNGKVSSLKTDLKDGDRLEIKENKIYEKPEIRIYDLLARDTDIEKIKVNGSQVDEDYILKEYDEINIIEEVNIESDKFLEDGLKDYDSLNITVNGQDMIIDRKEKDFKFIDIFNYIEFDRTVVRGNLVLLVNDKKAEYMQTLENGDNLKIYWD